MAKPSDPAKLAEYLARQARNSAAYRARQKAAKLGVEPPKAAKLKKPANYRPPRVSGNEVVRARARAEDARRRRAEKLAQLPDVRNTRARLRAGEQTERGLPVTLGRDTKKTRAGQRRQAEAIRENVEAARVVEVGRRRKQSIRAELSSGGQSERLRDTMTGDQQRRFQAAVDRIASGSNQSIGVLFQYAGGADDYNAAIERMLASPESRDVEEGLEMLEALGETADKARDLYSPKRIGTLRI